MGHSRRILCGSTTSAYPPKFTMEAGARLAARRYQPDDQLLAILETL
jgi:hypothetical protein